MFLARTSLQTNKHVGKIGNGMKLGRRYNCHNADMSIDPNVAYQIGSCTEGLK